MKAAIYTRVSTEEQEREGTSLQTQLEACKGRAKELGYEVTNKLAEVYSGLTLDRPNLSELRELIRARKIDTVIAYTLDRLSRNPVHFIILQDEMEKSGIELILITETIENSDLGKLITHIKGYAAKLEAEKIRERSMRGKRSRIEQGRLACGGGSKLYGYDYLTGKGAGEGVRYINAEQAEWARKIYEWFGEELLTMRQLVLLLHSMDIKSPTGKEWWSKSTLQKLLRNPCYTGRTYCNTQRRKEAGFHRKSITKYRLSSVEHRPKEDWKEIPGATPPIISEELFNKAQNRLARNKELSPRNSKKEYLLSGYIYCQKCGRRYIGGCRKYETRQGTKYWKYYHCSRTNNVEPNKPCLNKAWSAARLENIIWNEVENALTKPKLVMLGIKAVKEEAKQSNKHSEVLETIRAQQDHVEREKDRVWKAFELTGDQVKFETEIKTIMTKIDELHRSRTDLEGRIEASQQADVDIKNIRQACKLVRNNLKELTFETRRRCFEALSIKVWLDKQGNITIEGTIPISYDAIESTTSIRHEAGTSSCACR